MTSVLICQWQVYVVSKPWYATTQLGTCHNLVVIPFNMLVISVYFLSFLPRES